jgi:MFS transporter, DHA1 family, tetracycline resistance protein
VIRTLVIITALCNVAFMIFNTVIGPISRLVGMPEWQIGAMVSTAGLSWMLASRPWGLAGDRNGHWASMRIGLIWFVIGFVGLCAVGIAGVEKLIGPMALFILLFVLRSFLGVMFAVVPVASQGLIAQRYEPKDRPGVLAALGAAGAIGMVLGPALGGALGALSLWYPLLVAALLAVIALLLTLRSDLKDSISVAKTDGETKTTLGWTDPRIRWPMFVAFGAMFCVMSAQVNTAFFIMDRLHVTADQSTGYTGLALTCVGVAIVISQLIVQLLSKRGKGLTPNQMIAFGASIACLGFFGSSFVQSVLQVSLCYFVCGFGMGFVFPAFGAIASTAVDTHEVGAAAGTVGAAQAMGMLAGPIIATLVFKLEPRYPYYMIAALLAIMAIMAFRKLSRPEF